MFDMGWSELIVIAAVALIVIGPKELPGVLRMVGQWMGKARRMASEFQGQFQEAMREAEMADLKKEFAEVKDVATGLASGNILTSLQKDVSDSLQIGDIDKPAIDKPAAAPAPSVEAPATLGDVATEPLPASSEAPPQPAPQEIAAVESHPFKSVKAS